MVWRILPYCGSPPVPADLWTRWNLDPLLITALVVVALAYQIGMGRAGGRTARRSIAFLAGWALTAVALISPLCPLSVALFSARVGQHMVLTLAAAPLVALGRPDLAIAGWLGRAAGRRPASAPLAAAAFAILLWFWHAPAPYALTFHSTAAYWAMHLSLIGASIWLWLAMVRGLAEDGFKVALVAAASSIQMGLLGGLITLASHAVYAPHALTTAPWGLTPLEDQQLGGALMWAPGCLAFFGMALVAFGAALARAGRPAPVRGSATAGA